METKIIGKKTVYIVEKHQEVIEAWARVCNHSQNRHSLITFDHHTDLHKAFLKASFRNLLDDYSCEVEQKAAQERANLLREFSTITPYNVGAAISRLAHDEHIDFALENRWFTKVYVFLGYSDSGTRHPAAKIFSFDPCWRGCDKDIHDDDCQYICANRVIESSELIHRIQAIEAIEGSALCKLSYVLDFDLDVFSTKQSITPNDSGMLNELIRHAAAITIARESRIVACAEGGPSLEPLTSDYLLENLEARIAAALS